VTAARPSWPAPVEAPRLAAAVTFALTLALYLATLAPDVTFWDAGELASAAHALGVPHPPGTPLWVALAHVWARAFAVLGVATAPALNALSAACTAIACAATAWLVARWWRDPRAGVAAGIAAGAMATIWLDATETEVYAASLLLGLLALACAERRGAGGDARWLAAAAYCLGLAGPLHLSALVVVPGVVVLAARDDAEGWRRGDLATLGGATLLAYGLGTASVVAIAIAVVALLATAFSTSLRGPLRRRDVALVAVAVVVAASAMLVMLVRARHDPIVNQGDPSTWARFVDVVARRQYAVAPLWPRQAPLWIQLANVAQYADVQVGLALSALPTPSPARTIAAIGWMLLAVVGARAHHRAHRRSWLAMLLLLVGGSLGVAAQLNLKAGPTIGWGILPDGAPHEARERDYFFTVAWWAWGAWAGMGAAALANVRGRWALALAALPIALNWRGVTRRREPEASLPARLAVALLESAAPRAVLFARGDNDSYPLWYQQVVLGRRRDVTVVTVPLLAATWYRAELARRAALLDDSLVARWRGERPTLRAIATRARSAGRPVAVSIAMPRAEREAVGEGWVLRGHAYEWLPGASAWSRDSLAAARAAKFAAGIALPDAGPTGGIAPAREPVARWARRLLNCPRAALGADPASPPSAQLDSLCNIR
jgi:hypothetical protein